MNAQEEEFILDFANFLLKYNFTPSEAMVIARDFAKKHKKKLKQIL
jgi:hypothetical protein